MGLFDTVHFKEPLHLPGCADPVTEVQTKEFGNMMQDYRVGSVLAASPVLIGVVEESIWCKPQEEGGEGTTHFIYFAIWHRILAGVYLDPAEAEARLRTVDRADLIAWLDKAQRSTRSWQGRYHSLYRDVDEWQERKNETGAESDSEERLRRFLRRLPDEIIQAEDPLAAILDKHRRNEEEPDDGDGWLW